MVTRPHNGYMKVSLRRQNKIWFTPNNDFAVINDSRNWWIIAPVIDGVVQYGSLDQHYIQGAYSDAAKEALRMSQNG